MSAAFIDLDRDPRSRFDGGFDRWSYAARAGWAILWHGSDRGSYAAGENHSVWIWDETGRIWMRLPGDEAHTVYREHELTMRRLRRAVLVTKLIDSDVPGEREAARSALQRIAAAITEDWQFSRGSRFTDRAVNWFDHPAAVYLAVTQDCRFHLLERERLPFDAGIFAQLVASAQEDFEAGRRAQPPRLRPVDLVHLQTNVSSFVHQDTHVPPDEDTHAREEAASVASEASRKAETDRILNLREAVADAVQREIRTEEDEQRRRRRFWRMSGALAASALLAVMVGILT